MKKLLIPILYILILIPLIIGVPPVTTTRQITEGYFIDDTPQTYLKFNNDYQYNFFVTNLTTGKALDNNTISCTFYLANSTGGVIYYESVPYNIVAKYWGFLIDKGNFSSKGYYYYGTRCNSSDLAGTTTGEWMLNPLGKGITEGKSILYIGFLGLLLFAFFLNFYGMGFLPARNQVDEEGKIMSITYLKYFRNVLWMTGYFIFIGIFFIASNIAFAFLEEELIAKTLYMVFQVSLGLSPIAIIVWVIWIFASMFHDKEFQRMLNRGIFPQGKL